MFGNAGDDWIEGGQGADLLHGDNGDPFGTSTLIGHDVLMGDGNDDYEGESGNDIMFGTPGINKSVGDWGFDWVTYANSLEIVNADLELNVFLPPNILIDLFDRFVDVEGLSGWHGNDSLKGRINRNPLAEVNHVLDANGINMISGLSTLLRGATSFTGGDIILGGGGSDVIEGRGGDDIIHGDVYLDARIRLTNTNGTTEFATTINTFQARLLAGTIRPFQLSIVREIRPGSAGVDVAVFSGNQDDYAVVRNADNSITVTDNRPPAGGLLSNDGVDTLWGIEVLRFADGDVAAPGPAGAATGVPVISDTTPTEGVTITANTAGIADINGLGVFSYTWEMSANNGTTWTVVGTNSQSFTPTQTQVGQIIRVQVAFTDGAGNSENLISQPTGVVGDLFTGTAASNLFSGTDGDDQALGLGGNDNLIGSLGDDTLIGGDGDDSHFGGVGNDSMVGGLGNDTYGVDSALDVIVEAAAAGTDTVNSSVDHTLAANVEHLTLTGAALTGTGNTLANAITGNTNNNTLNGLDGNDTLDGGGGNDTMNGGLGDDSYLVDSLLDAVVEVAAAGTDTVFSSITLALGANTENLVLTGTAAINGSGNGLANLISGNAAANNLIGADGNDTLDGGAGADTMTGGLGDDTYIVDSTLDVVVEAAAGGIDTVNSSVDTTLGAELENLVLTGTALNGTGNAANNVITGNAANNTLNGGDGSDRLVGGAGLDTFQFNSPLAAGNVDTVADFAAGDTLQLNRAIFSALSGGATLTAAEFLSGAGVVAATDGLQRILHDTASGALRYDSDGNGTGAAVLFANLNPGAPLTAAAIALTGTAPAINGTINADNLLGTAGNNTINGLAGNDTIDGLAGNDTMNGGLGDDIFTVDSALDVVVEALNEGTDTVLSSVNHTLAANVENLTLTGTALNGTGNALANTLAGTASNNTLNGGAGADTMTGGLGDDTYIVDSTLDVVVEAAAGGIDTVNSSVDTTLGAELENLVLTGTALNGTGNAANNVITGNAANNTLNGGDGSDRLVGGAGLDTFQFNSPLAAGNVDTVADFAAGDTLQLNRAIFSALSGGATLTAAEFLSGAGVVAATDGLQRILHDTASGALRYDSDGNGTGAAVLFANLNPGAPLTAAAIALTGTAPAINGTINADNLLGTAGNNTINGLAGNDTIDGLAGNDTMNGGLGDDIFTVDSALDVVVEALNEGTDTVLSSVNHTLAANVENLTLTGTALNGTGNALANTLAGTASNNTLNGGAGADILNGGAGVDTLTGGLGADSFRFDAHGAANTDLITDFNIAEGDRIALSATVFTGIGAAGASLTAVQFRSGAGVVTANARDQRILFNTTTGALFWDADGSRITFGPIQFATLNPVATLTNTQFTLV